MPIASTRIARASMVPVGGVALAIMRVASRLSSAIRGDINAKDEPPTTVAKDSERNRRVLAKLKRLKQPYEVVPGLGNGHVETIFAAFFRSQPAVKYHRDLILCTTDGGCVALDWPVEANHENEEWKWDDLPDDAPVVVLFPGLTGGSGDSYVKHMVLSCRKNGMRAVVFNSRSTADSPVTTPQFYSASFTGDARDVVTHVHTKYPDSLLFAAGWSLGANILVRYLGEVGEDTPLRAAISLCNPFDLTLSDKNFQKGFNRVYDYKLGRTLSGMFKKHIHLFDGMEKQGFKPQIAANAYTIRDFDEAVTRVSFGFNSVDEYYEWSGSCHVIPKVRIPLLCVQAADDPIAPAHAIPYDEIRYNDNCILVVTPNGGHLGWISGETAPFGAPWTDSLCADFLNSMKQEMIHL